MMRRALVAAALCAASLSSVVAKSFWDSKPYTDWSSKEVERMVSDSPWAQRLSVVIPTTPRVTEDASRPARGVDDIGRGFAAPAPQLRLLLTWRSAIPVRQALIRMPNGVTNEAVDEVPLLERPQNYVVTLAGVPARLAPATAAATTAWLRRGRKPPIPGVTQGGMRQDNRALLTLIYVFPRTEIGRAHV